METLPYAPIILKLFKGVIYSDDAEWNKLQSYLEPIRQYFSKIGLEVRNHEVDGFAYLIQPEDESNSFPRLTTRYPLSFNMTIFGVLLREQLLQFNTNEATEQLIINIEKIRTLLEPYLAKHYDVT